MLSHLRITSRLATNPVYMMSYAGVSIRGMAGHSKWKTTKHKKGAADAKRSQAFAKMSLAISVAARSEADPASNPALALAIKKAKSVNMPKSNIENAINKFSNKGDGDAYEEVLYEGTGINGTAVMIEALTDNRKRTAPQLRSVQP